MVFLISAISSLENSLSWRKPEIVEMGRECRPPAISNTDLDVERDPEGLGREWASWELRAYGDYLQAEGLGPGRDGV